MASPAAGAMTFSQDQFAVHRKIFAFAPQFTIYSLQGQMIGYCKQKLFKLKEDIRIYADESMTRELLLIKARQIIDFSAAYDVVDALTQQKVGALKRQGWKSILRDKWTIMDANDQEIGLIEEDSAFRAFLRRFVEYAAALLPQAFSIHLNGSVAGTARQNYNFFAPKMAVDFTPDVAHQLDRRLGMAAIILLMAIEGRQG